MVGGEGVGIGRGMRFFLDLILFWRWIGYVVYYMYNKSVDRW